ncbi:MAG TPA: hypothetical protein VMA86_06220 [Acetobacteraceae bacterium]|nr:hypothetical protein [Acetobacteraceae bacterium]
MVHLVLIFCLSATPNMCKQVQPPFEQPYGSLMGCMVQAQFVASDMLRDRLDLQGYRLARWRCVSGEPGMPL